MAENVQTKLRDADAQGSSTNKPKTASSATTTITKVWRIISMGKCFLVGLLVLMVHKIKFWGNWFLPMTAPSAKEENESEHTLTDLNENQGIMSVMTLEGVVDDMPRDLAIKPAVNAAVEEEESSFLDNGKDYTGVIQEHGLVKDEYIPQAQRGPIDDFHNSESGDFIGPAHELVDFKGTHVTRTALQSTAQLEEPTHIKDTTYMAESQQCVSHSPEQQSYQEESSCMDGADTSHLKEKNAVLQEQVADSRGSNADIVKDTVQVKENREEESAFLNENYRKLEGRIAELQESIVQTLNMVEKVHCDMSCKIEVIVRQNVELRELVEVNNEENKVAINKQVAQLKETEERVVEKMEAADGKIAALNANLREISGEVVQLGRKIDGMPLSRQESDLPIGLSESKIPESNLCEHCFLPMTTPSAKEENESKHTLTDLNENQGSMSVVTLEGVVDDMRRDLTIKPAVNAAVEEEESNCFLDNGEDYTSGTQEIGVVENKDEYIRSVQRGRIVDFDNSMNVNEEISRPIPKLVYFKACKGTSQIQSVTKTAQQSTAQLEEPTHIKDEMTYMAESQQCVSNSPKQQSEDAPLKEINARHSPTKSYQEEFVHFIESSRMDGEDTSYLKEKNAELQEQVADLRGSSADIVKMQERIAELEKEIVQVKENREEIAKNEDTATHSQAAITQLQEEFVFFKESSRKLEERNAELQKKMVDEKGNNVKMQERIAELEKEIVQVKENREEIAKNEDTATHLQAAITQLQEEFAFFKESSRKLEERNAELQKKMVDEKGNNVKMQERIAELEKEIVQVKENREEIAKNEDTATHLQAAITQVQEEFAFFKESSRKLEERNAELQKKMVDEKGNNVKMQERIAELEKEIVQVKENREEIAKNEDTATHSQAAITQVQEEFAFFKESSRKLEERNAELQESIVQTLNMFEKKHCDINCKIEVIVGQNGELRELVEVNNEDIAQNKVAINRQVAQLKDVTEELVVEKMEAADGEIVALKANLREISGEVAQLKDNVEINSETILMVERRVYLDSDSLFLMARDSSRGLAQLGRNIDRLLRVMWRLIQYNASLSRQESALTQRVRLSYFNTILTTDGTRGQRSLNRCLQEYLRCPHFDRAEAVYAPNSNGSYDLTVSFHQQGMGELEAYLAGNDGQMLFMGATNSCRVPGFFSRIVTLQRGYQYWIEERQVRGQARMEWCQFSGHLIR